MNCTVVGTCGCQAATGRCFAGEIINRSRTAPLDRPPTHLNTLGLHRTNLCCLRTHTKTVAMLSGYDGVDPVVPYSPGRHIELIGMRGGILPQMTCLDHRQYVVVKHSSAQSGIVQPRSMIKLRVRADSCDPITLRPIQCGDGAPIHWPRPCKTQSAVHG